MKTCPVSPDPAVHLPTILTPIPPARSGDHNPPLPLPPGWRSLATGRRNMRLYQVTRPGEAGVYWEGSVILRQEIVHRRFASELHARAWLGLAIEKRPSGVPFDLGEFSGSIRAISVAGTPFRPAAED